MEHSDDDGYLAEDLENLRTDYATLQAENAQLRLELETLIQSLESTDADQQYEKLGGDDNRNLDASTLDNINDII